MAYYKCGQIYVTENTNTSVGTASGAVSTFNTLVSKPLVSLKASFKATQASGTPTPSNPISINGVSSVKVTNYGGSDLLDNVSFELGYINSQGTIATSTVWSVSDYIAVAPSKTYIAIKLATAGSGGYCASYKTDKTLSRTFEITANQPTILALNNDEAFLRVSVRSATPQTFGSHLYIIDTDITISLNNTYYGGYVLKDNSGSKLIINYAYADLGDFTWNSTADGYSQSPIIPNMKKSAGGAIKPNLFSEKLLVDTPANVYNKVTDNTISISIVGANSGLRVYMMSLSGYTGAQVKSALSGFKIAYELETPIELPLTDIPDITTLVGVNNVFNDSGDTECQYTSLPYTIETASGAVANFSTSLALPLISAKYDIDAVQESGTPTPSAPLAISGWNAVKVTRCGKNLYSYDASKVKSGTTTAQAQRAYFDLGLTNCTLSFSGSFKSGVTPHTRRINIGRLSNGQLSAIYEYIANGTVTPRTVTYGATERAVLILTLDDTEILKSALQDMNLQVENSSSATTYEAYTGTEITINLGDTIYGGVLDVKNDVLRVTHIPIDWEDVTITYSSTYGFLFTLSELKTGIANITNILKCSHYMNAGTAGFGYITEGKIGTNSSGGVNTDRVCIKDSNYSDASTFKSFLINSNVQLVYELATPIEISLSDIPEITTLIGTNNIFADSGDSEVVYKKSV